MTAYNASFPVTSGADLSSDQHKAINISGTLAVAATGTTGAKGILQNKPNAAGQDATLVYAGRAKFVAGGTIAAGGQITVSSGGWFTAAAVASGNSTDVVGFAEVAVASGGVGFGIFNFVNQTLVAFA